jgi:hypothetical protein
MTSTKYLAVLVLTISLAGFTYGEPIGTAFTYQGHLYDANHAANGSYDFQFSLFDSLADGNQVGSDVNKNDVNVIDGYFTVELDFGDVFAEELRWLEINVRDGDSSGAFTTLSPRQKITAVPYAISVGELAGSRIVGGRISGTPPVTYPFEFDISDLGVGASDVMVVASGSKLTSIGEPETPLMIKWDVNESPLTVKFRVWDSDGVQYWPTDVAWIGKQIDMSFAAFTTDANTGQNCNFEDIDGQLSVVMGGLVDNSWANENPAFEFVDSEGQLGEFSTDEDVNAQVNVNVIGWKEDSMSNKVEPLMVYPLVERSGTNIKVSVWVYDIDGTAYTKGDFLGDILRIRITCYKTSPAIGP